MAGIAVAPGAASTVVFFVLRFFVVVVVVAGGTVLATVYHDSPPIPQPTSPLRALGTPGDARCPHHSTRRIHRSILAAWTRIIIQSRQLGKSLSWKATARTTVIQVVCQDSVLRCSWYFLQTETIHVEGRNALKGVALDPMHKNVFAALMVHRLLGISCEAPTFPSSQLLSFTSTSGPASED